MSKSRDIADSAATINYIDNVTSNVQSQINTLDTALDNISVTSGTLTKTFAQNETASISLTSSVLAPVVFVTKEIPQTGVTNNSWDVNSTTENYTRLDSAYATTLSFTGGGSPFVLGTGSFSSADVGKTIEANSGVFVLTATDGSYVETTAPTSYDSVASGAWGMYAVVYNAADGDLQLSTYEDIYNFSGMTAVGNRTLYGILSGATNPEDFWIKEDGTRLFAYDSDKQAIYQMNFGTAYSISTLSYQYQFSETERLRGITLSSNGLYIFGTTTSTIYRYNLSSSYTMNSSMSKFGTSYNSGVGGYAIDISNDGTKLFCPAGSGTIVKTVTLSTAYNLSGASTDAGTNLNGGSASGPYQSIRFKENGTKLFLYENGSTDYVYEYYCATPFDLSTASYVKRTAFSTAESNAQCFDVVKGGTKAYVAGSSQAKIYEYNSGAGVQFPTGYHPVHTTSSIDSTYWTDINSMTADQAAGNGNVYYAISTDDRTTWSVIHNTNGERDIVRNNGGTWQYNSNSTYASATWTNGSTNTELATLAQAMNTTQNRMDKTQLDAVTDPNHIALGNDLDLAIVFNMTSGSTVPSSDGVAINYDANVLNKGAVLGTDYDFDAPTQNSVRITALAANNLKVRVV